MTTDAPNPPAMRDAATVMLVRDADHGGAGIEVFMLRRNLQSDFVGGAYVFPGGAVDPHDRADDLDSVCAGRSDADASAQLGIERGGLAFWVAAIRECFEEAGVLLARPPGPYQPPSEGPDRTLIDLTDPDVAARFTVHRQAVDRGERRLVDVCRQEGLQLAVDDIHYFSHWITPEGAPRRYDTRFFVTRAPAAQEALHDDREVIANLWIRPDDALQQHRAGRFELVFPTMRSLMALRQFDSADELLRHAASIAEVPTVLPRIVEDEGGFRIVLPGDPEYGSRPSAVLPEGIPMNKLPMAGTAGPAVSRGR